MNAKRILVTILLVVVVLGSFFAHPQPVKAAGVTVGPYRSSSPDSGTCGNDWGGDLFDRLFTDVTSGGFTEWFNNGTFTTVAGSSPGACQSGNNGKQVVAGVTGDMGGSFDVEVAGATQFTPGACNSSNCGTTMGFVHTVYGNSATANTGATFFDFHYRVCDGRAWYNRSSNLGGNSGDIAGGLPDPVGACAPSSSWKPLFTDGRLNNRPEDGAAPAYIYSFSWGFQFWGGQNQQGILLLMVTCEDIARVPARPTVNTLIKETKDHKVRVFRLTTGEFQMNARWPDGGDYVFIWTGTQCPTN